MRQVKASEIVRNPKNWRKHTQEQADVLRGVLEDVGWAGATICRELDDGRLMLIDGELRSDTADDEELPVLVLDVTEEEADKLLATLDPIAGMAKTDNAAFEELLAGLTSEHEALETLLRSRDSGGIIEKLRPQVPPDTPRHECIIGQVFGLNDRHVLVVEDVLFGWEAYAKYLKGDVVFVPYAGPLVQFTKLATERPLVMVQPIPFVASIILDWCEDAYGSEAIRIL